jgi:rare lipoprotein A (peptidoglycan hydrolase)
MTSTHATESIVNLRAGFMRKTKDRIIDLTPAAAHQLDFSGLVPVALDVVTAPAADR